MIVVGVVLWLFALGVVALDIYARNWPAAVIAAICLVAISAAIKVNINLRRATRH